MPYGMLSPIDISPVATGVWASVDVTSHASPHKGNVGGVIVYVVNTDLTNAWTVGARKNGSVSTPLAVLKKDSSLYLYVGVDAEALIRVYRENTAIVIYMIGLYTRDEVVFFTEPIDVSLGVQGSWQTVSVAAYVGTDSPVVGLFRVTDDSNPAAQVGVRAVGSTAADTALFIGQSGVVVKLDSNQACEMYVADADYKVYFVGYQVLQATMETTKIDKSTAALGSYSTVTYTGSARMTGVYFHLTNDTTNFQRRAIHRAVGSTFDEWRFLEHSAWGWSPVSSAGQGEQKINNTEMNLFFLGYTEDPLTSLAFPLPGRSIHGGVHQFDGGLT